MIAPVPLLVEPALPAGALRSLSPPRLVVDDQLVLRPWRPDEADATVVRTAFALPDIQRWHLRRMDSDAEAHEWVTAWGKRWDAETDGSWAIADARDDQAIGQIGLRTVVLAEGQAQLSYWVLPAARRAGVAARAAHTLTAWGFTSLGLRRLFLVHSTANEPSCRVAHRAGFAYEGTLRGYLRHTDGWHDVHIHGRLATDGPTGGPLRPVA
jgi:RimJ/RimL family protein N-acetyltransferase